MNARVILLCFLITVVVGLFGTRTLVQTIHDQNVQKAQIKRDITEADAGIKKLQTFKTQLDQRKEDVKVIELALPPSEGIPEVLVMLENLYQAQGFTVTSLSVNTQADNTASIPTTISGNSSFDQLFGIFSNVQQNIRPVQVKNFSATGAEGGKVSASFSLGFPFAKSETKATPSETPTASEQ